MSASESEILAYFARRRLSFWQWSEDGQVITWADGKTIAFRDEIKAVLQHLAPSGLPPFGAIIVLLAACRDGWFESTTQRDLMSGYARTLEPAPAGRIWPFALEGARPMTYSMRKMLEKVFAGLDAVARLRPELRGNTRAKAILCEMVFEKARRQLSPAAALEAARTLGEGLTPESLLNFAAPATDYRRFAEELEALSAGLGSLNEDQLALRMRTGLEQLVEPAPLDLPPSLRVRKLLGELRGDRELAGLAQLAQRLMAAVHIPRAISSPEELPLGGVSDLTNRGPFDRLLISELAHDDLTLAVRVALNEALYLRRESPAATPFRRRAILLDAGIRLWGIPRIYATAVGLALAATTERGSDLALYRARGKGIESVTLTTRAGLVAHLEALEPASHPGDALRALREALRQTDANASGARSTVTERILVTHDDVLMDPDFAKMLHEHLDDNWNIAAVSRDGAFRLCSINRQGRRTISAAKLSLDDVLAPPAGNGRPVPLKDSGIDSSLPVILSLEPFPLLLPHAPDLRQLAGRSAVSERHGVVMATTDGRLLQWRNAVQGGCQLTAQLPPGRLHGVLIDDEQGIVRAVTSMHPGGRLSLLNVDLNSRRCTRRDVPIGHPLAVCYHNRVLLAILGREVLALNPDDGSRLATMRLPFGIRWREGRYFAGTGGRARYYLAGFDGAQLRLDPVDDPEEPPLLSDREPLAFCTQSRIIPHWRFSGIAVGPSGRLMLYGGGRVYALLMNQRGEIILSNQGRSVLWAPAVVPFRRSPSPPHTRYKLKVATWREGSRAYLDSRGMLHLKSSDRSLPEITLVLTNEPLAGWLSEGGTFGWQFFQEGQPTLQASYVYEVIGQFAARVR